MISSGIDKTFGLAYEADSSKHNGRLLWPAPVISHAKILPINSKEFVAKSSQEDPFGYIFREDFFDPITKIRRGRFYKAEGTQPQRWICLAHPAKPFKASSNLDGPKPEELFTYTSNQSFWNEHIKGQQEKPLIILGLNDSYTVWEIISVEEIYTREDLVTLKARDSLGTFGYRWCRLYW